MKYLAILLTSCASLLADLPPGTSVCVSLSAYGVTAEACGSRGEVAKLEKQAEAQLNRKLRAKGIVKCKHSSLFCFLPTSPALPAASAARGLPTLSPGRSCPPEEAGASPGGRIRSPGERAECRTRRGDGCARPGKPGVYTSVASVREWIEACAR